jgi:hypothetical protein
MFNFPHSTGRTYHPVLFNLEMTKMITDAEIELHQDFFEQCAKDYRRLATQLITDLAAEFKVTFNPDFPYLTALSLRHNGYAVNGMMGNWRHMLHGHHYRFHHAITLQTIDVALSFGSEFGILDPCFFLVFINSTPEYRPLPVTIHDEYSDGCRIIEKMTLLGKFEEIQGNIEGRSGCVVTDREKVKIKVYSEKQMTEILSLTFSCAFN